MINGHHLTDRLAFVRSTVIHQKLPFFFVLINQDLHIHILVTTSLEGRKQNPDRKKGRVLFHVYWSYQRIICVLLVNHGNNYTIDPFVYTSRQ